MENFENLGLSKEFLKLLEKADLVKPSEIQGKAIPLVLKGKDVIGGSATGSGKTLAFGAGIIENVQKNKGLQALILTPTRELAEQVGKVLRKFSEHKKLNVTMVYGGVNINPQINALRNSEIVVGTPGRILDHLERRTIRFSEMKTLVLDEADRMLDMGFITDIERILSHCPKERQTLLFSATISHDIIEIAEKHMRNPTNISVESYVDPTKLKQIYYDVQRSMKFSLLIHLLKKERSGLIMVFCNTRQNADFVADNLNRMKIDALSIHGGLAQEKRNKIMEKFHGKNIYVMVCTDVAARGLDIKGVSHVYNYDIPKTSKEYIHRIGRTARAGKEGIAINILADRDYENFSNVLRDKLIHVEKEEVPKMEFIRVELQEKKRFGQRNFGRESENRGRYSPGRRDAPKRSSRPDSRRDSGKSFGNGNSRTRSDSGTKRESGGRNFRSDRPRRDLGKSHRSPLNRRRY
jgi:ATP-dependent RNA helicase DeaD